MNGNSSTEIMNAVSACPRELIITRWGVGVEWGMQVHYGNFSRVLRLRQHIACVGIQKTETVRELNKQTSETITSASASLWIETRIKMRGGHNPDPNDGAMELYNRDVWPRSRHWPVMRHRALRTQVKMHRSVWASSTCAVNNAPGLRPFPSGPHFCAALLLSKQKQQCSYEAYSWSWGALQGSAMSPNQGHHGRGDTWNATSPRKWCPSCQRASSGSEQHSCSCWR